MWGTYGITELRLGIRISDEIATRRLECRVRVDWNSDYGISSIEFLDGPLKGLRKIVLSADIIFDERDAR